MSNATAISVSLRQLPVKR